MKATKLGVVFMPRSVSLTIEIARAAEKLGFWGLGICDSPILYHELYPVISACLLSTERLVVGPNVTNPVTRHWTIHAASARAFAEMSPERYFLGIAAGDGAVHGVGIRPAKARELEEEVTRIREHAPATMTAYVAAGGPRMAEVAGRSGSGAILGTGIDVLAVRMLRDRALAARRARPIEDPFETWALVHLRVVEDESDVERAREEIKPLAIANARHAFAATFEAKNVPEEYQALMRERFPRYDFLQHAQVTSRNDNAQLFADHPEIESYIVDRFAIVGTPEECAERLETFVAQADVDGIWLPTVVQDPLRNLELAARSFRRFLAE